MTEAQIDCMKQTVGWSSYEDDGTREGTCSYLTNIRDCYLDLRCKPLLDDKILAFAREPPPRGQAGRYIVKYGKLEAVVAVNGQFSPCNT